MSSLRHPNVTQFLGLCYLPGSQLPLLIMELLETSLDDLLENMPNIPMSLKRSVLEDVAKGLLYLHKRNPPVIHRDLTSKNVLLTPSLVAKITDMGNSRIVRPGQVIRTLSALPGTLVYMPPEARDDSHRYGPSLDIFSFGHLALFTIIQVISYYRVICTIISNASSHRNFPVTCYLVPTSTRTILKKFEAEVNWNAVGDTLLCLKHRLFLTTLLLLH